MYLPESRDAQPVETIDDLVEQFRSACKPRQEWRIGSETEMIGVYRGGPDAGGAPPHGGPRGIGVLLDRIAASGWQPIREGGHIIALSCHDAQITIEPGGQLELAARPITDDAVFESDLVNYQNAIAQTSARLDIAWLGVGFRPFGTIGQVPWMPKRRYAIMRDYLPTRGKLAHEMMLRTATTQVNLDFSDERDAAAKLRCVMGITPILTSLFASSPIVDGRVSGYQSYRARIWLDTDHDRCGILPFAFEDGDVFEAYTQWALDVPMFFVHRGDYQPAGGTTFRQFMTEGFHGARATLDDWALHLSTLFPEARLKRFMEIRGCDAGTRPMILSLGPLSRGLLYDDTAMRAAIELTAGLSFEQRLALQRTVPRSGLATPVGDTGRTIGDLARELLAIAADGLSRQAPAELRFLEPLQAIAGTRRTRADEMIALWHETGGDPTRVIPRLAHPALGDGTEPPPDADLGCCI